MQLSAENQKIGHDARQCARLLTNPGLQRLPKGKGLQSASRGCTVYPGFLSSVNASGYSLVCLTPQKAAKYFDDTRTRSTHRGIEQRSLSCPLETLSKLGGITTGMKGSRLLPM